MSGPRLPSHLEVTALIRAAEAAGGVGTVLAMGERDAGVILVLTMEKGEDLRLWERMPRLDGKRTFQVVRVQDTEKKEDFTQYLERRKDRDRDMWLVELDIPNPERFIAACQL